MKGLFGSAFPDWWRDRLLFIWKPSLFGGWLKDDPNAIDDIMHNRNTSKFKIGIVWIIHK